MSWILNDPPPKFGAELAECQRRYIHIENAYAAGYSWSATRAAVFLPLPVTLASNPTITVVAIGKLIINGQVIVPSNLYVIKMIDNGLIISVQGNGFTVGVCELVDFEVTISCDL